MKKEKKLEGLRLFFPVDILSDTRLSPLDRFLIAIIIAMDNKDGCFMTNPTLAKHTNCSVGSISKSISKLEEYGYIVFNQDISGRGYKRVTNEKLKKHKAG